MFKLGKNIILDLESRKVEKILIFFYDSGCSGTKVDMKEDFDITQDIEKLQLNTSFDIYLEKKDMDKFDGATITKVVKSDHTGKEKIRYIFSNEKVKERCGCGSSFSFEKKQPKLNLEKLKSLKTNFKK